jgi:hypothetical protein
MVSMFEADLSRTNRNALPDFELEGPARFAKASLAAARAAGSDTVIWHFTSRESVSHLGDSLGGAPARLLKRGEAVVEDVRIVLTTRQGRDPAGAFKLPLAAWWPGDDGMLALDSTARPELLALVASPWRLRIWLTAFDLAVAEPEVDDDFAVDRHDQEPIAVSAELQEIVRRQSASMTLSSNGIHDSLGPAFLKAVRPLIRAQQATPEAVAVAALRAGWWPEKIPALLRKLQPR